jgi:hypothetical protein
VTKEDQPIPDVVASKHGPEITTQPNVVATEKPITCQQAAVFGRPPQNNQENGWCWRAAGTFPIRALVFLRQ